MHAGSEWRVFAAGVGGEEREHGHAWLTPAYVSEGGALQCIGRFTTKNREHINISGT
jgi:hypothetical protein